MNKKNILIVEDNASYTRILREKLLSVGFEIAESNNGEDGLQKALEIKPDLILLDILLPRMNGFSMLHKLRETDKKVPVIILSTLSKYDEVLNKELKQLKPVEFFGKVDVNLKDLVSLIEDKTRKSAKAN